MLPAADQTHVVSVFVEVGRTSIREAASYAAAFDPAMFTALDPGPVARALQIYVHPVGEGSTERIEHSGTIILARGLTARKRLPHDIAAQDLAHEVQLILAETQPE